MNEIIVKPDNGLRIAICEDEPEQLSTNYNLLKSNADKMNYSFYLYTSGKELLADLEKGKTFDVLFCDIEMPEISGINLGNAVRKYNDNLILIYLTNYPQYAIQAYETRAFRYLLKPLDEAVVKDIMAMIQKEYNQYQKLVFKDWETIHFVDISKILYLEVRERYTFAYTSTRELSSKISLNEYESVLRKMGFFRIHRKYLVNCFYVKELKSGSLILDNDEELPIARSRRSNLKKIFYDAMERGIF